MEEESSESSGGFFSSMTNGTDKPAKVDVLTLSAEEEDETTKRVSLDETTTTQRSTSPAADDETTTSPAARVETGEDGGHDESHRWDLVRRRLTPKLQSRPTPSRWDLLIAHLQAVDDETDGSGGRNADLLFQETATDKAIQETKKPDMADAVQQIRWSQSHASWEGTTHVANQNTKISSSRVGHSWMLLVCPGKGNRPRPNAGVFVLIMLWTALWLVADCACTIEA